ncbi:MAG: hypothetical protein SVR04_09875 [Spirochaetota bacterium]|nr:hypothetical protein [Spirochaetota bacterium]
MLRQILQEGAVIYGDISSRLDIPEPLIRQMVWELERLGYLKPVFQGCSEHACAGCPMKCGTSTSLNKAFVLTSKGRNFAGAVTVDTVPGDSSAL